MPNSMSESLVIPAEVIKNPPEVGVNGSQDADGILAGFSESVLAGRRVYYSHQGATYGTILESHYFKLFAGMGINFFTPPSDLPGGDPEYAKLILGAGAVLATENFGYLGHGQVFDLEFCRKNNVLYYLVRIVHSPVDQNDGLQDGSLGKLVNGVQGHGIQGVGTQGIIDTRVRANVLYGNGPWPLRHDPDIRLLDTYGVGCLGIFPITSLGQVELVDPYDKAYRYARVAVHGPGVQVTDAVQLANCRT